MAFSKEEIEEMKKAGLHPVSEKGGEDDRDDEDRDFFGAEYEDDEDDDTNDVNDTEHENDDRDDDTEEE